ncbi:hypothetical protein CDD81_2932 [Ophiocordyceps australis]|uniref:Nucleoporin Nup159/Nup146 N-terminal domain-containing protein n=1 Tax=Ophiocordyceps australis TaxID=1399860 RepID=A0A2C5YHR2_9HYPO|nr:hypothetical protein CDD81_2932 [Ophiocordyceps australis]
MAFGGPRAPAPAAQGADLEIIETEALSFLSVAGDAKVRLTAAWPSPPTPTSSLLSIASRKGLVAAAGPDQLTVATTESVRKALESPRDGETEIRSFDPQLRVPMPMRVSQLAFTADESHLVLSAESGGGLAVYEVQSLLAASNGPAYELSTNGETLRHMVPNPTAEKAELCAFVTNGGNLHMANLKDRVISPVLKSQVSCACWSPKGKQLCAGLADGTIHQMTPEGETKAEIARPPGLGQSHVSSLSWLENNLFLVIHTTTHETPPSCAYHIIQRDVSSSSLLFRKMSDPVPSYTSNKMPHHSVLRLRDFPPNIQDVLIVSSTASTEIGLLTRSSVPLDSTKPADSITSLFTTTQLLDDTRRPTLPMTESMDDSTPIGIALDLSAKDKVYKPLPADEELVESPGPLPGLWVLTHEGVLCTWWLVYTESIKAGTSYPGLAAAGNGNAVATSVVAAPSTPSFGAAAFGSPASAAPAFGTPSQLGQTQSPFGTVASTTMASQSTPALGGMTAAPSAFSSTQPSTSSFANLGGMAFGRASQLGMRNSAWSTPGPVFGMSGFSNFAKSSINQGSLTAASPPSASSGFASFANQGGFASVCSSDNSKPSAFAATNKSSDSAFSRMGAPSADMDTSFPPPKDTQSSGSVFGSTPFKLESSFKPDPSQMEHDEKPRVSTSEPSIFSNDFGSALKDVGNTLRATTPPTIQDKDMDLGEIAEQTPRAYNQDSFFSPAPQEESTTPKYTPAVPRFTLPSSPLARVSQAGEPSLGNLPGKGALSLGLTSANASQETSTPQSNTRNKSAQSGQLSTTPTLFGSAPLPPDFVKLPGGQNASDGASTPEKPIAKVVPLPPDSDDEKATNKGEEAPLPPDFLTSGTTAKTSLDLPQVPQDSNENDQLDSDGALEDSVVDVAKDLDWDAAASPSLGLLSASSSSGTANNGKMQAEKPNSKPFFGALARNGPVFSPPNVASPRSTSPLRTAMSASPMAHDLTRSVSAPGMASGVLRAKKSQSMLAEFRASKASPGQSGTSNFLDQQKKKELAEEAEESKALVDEEDDEIQKILQSDVQGTLEVNEFIAYSNVMEPARESIPAQVEAVYRDINSMIDTLGLNARSIKAFVKGHTEKHKQGPMTREDLESPDDWVLCEASDLKQLLGHELMDDLEDGRTQNVGDKLDACRELCRDMQRLRAKQEELRRTIMVRLDTEQAESARALPLSTEQTIQQKELRQGVAALTSLLTQAEEALVLVKTKLASTYSSVQGSSRPAPTVDAIIRTILKMTAEAERRSGDIDVLQSQMHKLQLGCNGRDALHLMTPQGKRNSIVSSPDSTPSRGVRQSLVGGMASLGLSDRATPPRKKLSGFNREEKRDLMEKRAKRRAMLDKLKESVQKKSVEVWSMDEDIA